MGGCRKFLLIFSSPLLDTFFFPLTINLTESWNPIKTWAYFGLFSSVDRHAHLEHHVQIAWPMGSFFLSRQTLWVFTWDWTGCRSPSSTMWAESTTHFGCKIMAWGGNQVWLQLAPYCLLRVCYLIIYVSSDFNTLNDIYMVLMLYNWVFISPSNFGISFSDTGSPYKAWSVRKISNYTRNKTNFQGDRIIYCNVKQKKART